MMVIIMEELKNKVDKWEMAISFAEHSKRCARENLKKQEEELKKGKHRVYIAVKNWNEAKREYKKAFEILKRYPRAKRNWAFNNFGKVIDMMNKVPEVNE